MKRAPEYSEDEIGFHREVNVVGWVVKARPIDFVQGDVVVHNSSLVFSREIHQRVVSLMKDTPMPPSHEDLQQKWARSNKKRPDRQH